MGETTLIEKKIDIHLNVKGPKHVNDTIFNERLLRMTSLF